MEVFRLSGVENHLYFKNLSRIDERVIFDNVTGILSKTPGIKFGEEQLFPYSDELWGEYNGVEIRLILDTEEGTELYCPDKDSLNQLEKIISQQ